MLLTKQDGKLVLNTGMGTIPFAFGADKNTLLVYNESYKRITRERVEEIKSEKIKEENQEKEKKALCDAIVKEYKSEKDKIYKQQDIDRQKRQELNDATYKKYTDQAKEQGCGLGGFPLSL